MSAHTGDPDPALRILRPSSVTQLFKLDEIQSRPAKPELVAINPVWVYAAREGIEFRINSIRGCAGIRRNLATVRQPVGAATMKDFR